MIVRLTPEQIVAFWEAIKYGAVRANKVDEIVKIPYCNALLAGLLSGKYQGWVGFDFLEGEKVFLGVLLTALSEDELEGIKILTIHSIYAFRPIPNEIFDSSFQALTDFARAEGCKKIVAYTDNMRLQKIIEGYGFNSMTRYYSKEV